MKSITWWSARFIPIMQSAVKKPVSWWRTRLIPILLLGGMALFLNGQASRYERLNLVLHKPVTVIEGTAANYRTSAESIGRGNRSSPIVEYTVTLTQYSPNNVEFRFMSPPPNAVSRGARVRLEVPRDDLKHAMSNSRYPNFHFRVNALGATVNGQTLYTAAEEAAKDIEVSNTAANQRRIPALVCGLLAAALAALLVRRLATERRRQHAQAP